MCSVASLGGISSKSLQSSASSNGRRKSILKNATKEHATKEDERKDRLRNSEFVKKDNDRLSKLYERK